MIRTYFVVLWMGLAAACAGFAYNPPVDTAGPLTVQIEQPSLGNYGAGGLVQLAQADSPFIINVRVTNSADVAVEGTLRMEVIDRWKTTPAGPVRFRAEPHQYAEVPFTVTFGAGTFNAHYPVHVFAEFDHEGRHWQAQPVLVLSVNQPDPPRAKLPVEYAPVDVPQNGALGLWRLPVRREKATVESEALPGRRGHETFEDSPTIRTGPAAVSNHRRESISVQLGPRLPAKRERVRSALVEYPLQLPGKRPIRLHFATAVGDGASTEGAMFRVRVLPFTGGGANQGKVVFEQRNASSRWTDGTADLMEFAGQQIRLQLETEALTQEPVTGHWAEPTVEAGAVTKPAELKPPAQTTAASGRQTQVVLMQPGNRGLLDTEFTFNQGGRQISFQGFRVQVLGDPLEDWRAANQLVEVKEEPTNALRRVRHRFKGWAGSFDVLGEVSTERGATRVKFWLENVPKPRPWLDVHLEEVAAGPWSERASRVYAGVGNVIQNPEAFHLSFDGHHLATSFVGFDFPAGVSIVQAVDVPTNQLEVDPESRTYTLSTAHAQTITFIPAADVWQGARVWRDLFGDKAAGGVGKLAGRFVFDLWAFGANYAASARELERAFRYGLTDSAVVWHNWQRWGYDYRLPDVYPPNPAGGTLEDFRTVASVCRQNGVLFAPHDNYIDFYPDAEGFTYDDIAFQPDGEPVKAWFRFEFLAQSYRFRPDRLRPFLERNVKLIKEGIGPTAYFIDVWSSIAPYDYWTKDGQFVERSVTRKAWGESFAWIRDYLGDNAPQISEAGHDQLIGWLDGAQTNHLRMEPPSENGFVLHVQAADTERIPWLDMVHHDRFALHGAGYEERYAGQLDLKTHGIYSDDYMATEVLTGHPAMVPMPFGRDVVRKYWLLHDLMRGLALRRMDTVSFDGDNLHRQRVKWENGGEVFVNRGSAQWTAGGHALAQYGFYARVPVDGGTVEAAVEQTGGAVVEWARSPAMVYVNPRSSGQPVSVGAVTANGGVRLTREGDSVQVTPLPESGAFTVKVKWDALPWKAPAPSKVEVLDESGQLVRASAVSASGGEVEVQCEPGVFAYRLR